MKTKMNGKTKNDEYFCDIYFLLSFCSRRTQQIKINELFCIECVKCTVNCTKESNKIVYFPLCVMKLAPSHEMH